MPTSSTSDVYATKASGAGDAKLAATSSKRTGHGVFGYEPRDKKLDTMSNNTETEKPKNSASVSFQKGLASTVEVAPEAKHPEAEPAPDNRQFPASSKGTLDTFSWGLLRPSASQQSDPKVHDFRKDNALTYSDLMAAVDPHDVMQGDMAEEGSGGEDDYVGRGWWW